ncbi:hypothetical protein SGLAU_28305 [Streptomyces glaucescens]|uniref:Uncharacterized protein n=1 Tax=Streptomyces glaucescens TaxID=1907 RepID=A0A089XC85_STRGA|nr:hypothetical protein SGLAU_28305 [Streptomyces glaucescens]
MTAVAPRPPARPAGGGAPVEREGTGRGAWSARRAAAGDPAGEKPSKETHA